MPALAELRLAVSLLEVSVLLTGGLTCAGVPLGGGGQRGGGHPALLQLPGLDTLLALLAPDSRLAAVPVEAVAQEALAPLMAATVHCTAYTPPSENVLEFQLAS